ncbi:MAG: hypothetical protein WAK63_13020 [Xanthobacteraceae bacterium]
MINNAEFGIYRVGICYSEARCRTSQIQVFAVISNNSSLVARSAGRAGFLIEIKKCAVEKSFHDCHERQARSWSIDARLHGDGEGNRLRRQVHAR